MAGTEGGEDKVVGTIVRVGEDKIERRIVCRRVRERRIM